MPQRISISIWSALLALCLVMAGMTSLAHKARAGSLGVQIEGTAGLSVNSDELKGLGAGTTDFAQTGAVLGIGAGLVLQTNTVMATVFGRYSYANVVGDIGLIGSSFKTSNLIDTGVRLGLRATKTTTLYGEAGYGWEDVNLTMPGVASFKTSPQGAMLGAGIEHQLFNSNWLASLEYQHFFFGDQNLITGIASVTPDTNVIRAGLTYRFGETRPVQLPKEVEACDPKLFNCHSPLK